MPAPQAPLVSDYIVTSVPPWDQSNGGAMGASTLNGTRVICGKDGLLRNLYVRTGVNSGSWAGAVYDCTGPTRNLLWASAVDAMSAISGVSASIWKSPGDPLIPVYAGQQLELAISVDNGTATFAYCATNAGSGYLYPPGFVSPELGTTQQMSWSRGGSMAPASSPTILDSTFAPTSVVWLMMARIT